MKRLFHILFILIACVSLSGCYQEYFIKNIESEKYKKIGIFYESYLDGLKSNGILHLMNFGYYKRRTSTLIVFLGLESKEPATEKIIKYQIIDSKGLVFSEATGDTIDLAIDKTSGKEYKAAIRVEFHADNYSDLPDTGKLKIHINRNDEVDIIELEIHAYKELVFPT